MGTLVSICIPTRSERRLAYLREAVASALGQTHTDVEVLISDDAGEASIRQFAEQQAWLDPRVRYRRNEVPLGLGGNWDALVGDAQGEYLIIIGDDDRLLPEFVKKLLAAGSSDTVVIFANHFVINEKGERNHELTEQFVKIFARDGLVAGEVIDPAGSVWRNSIPMSASLIRTRDAKRLGIKADLNTPEIEMFARLAAEGKSFVFVPEYLAEYRVHSNSQTSAGLAAERLIKYLDPIVVPRHVEPLKRRLMNALVTDAVSKALRAGDTAEARDLLRHRYYPSPYNRLVTVLAHTVLAMMPGRVASAGVAAARRARRVLRAARRPR
jgi:glycosyltransferase involved in cell wall biosynthesis